MDNRTVVLIYCSDNTIRAKYNRLNRAQNSARCDACPRAAPELNFYLSDKNLIRGGKTGNIDRPAAYRRSVLPSLLSDRAARGQASHRVAGGTISLKAQCKISTRSVALQKVERALFFVQFENKGSRCEQKHIACKRYAKQHLTHLPITNLKTNRCLGKGNAKTAVFYIL